MSRGDARDAAVHGPPEREEGGGMDRRAFLSQLALLGAAVASFRCAEPKSAGLDLRPPLPPEAPAPFTPAQLATLAAACERILPGGEGIPGAADAGVIDFAAAELRRPELGEIRKRIDGGLLALDRRAARAFGGKRFADLGSDEQDRILRETQVGSLQGEEFLRILISLTLEGFLGDPAYGGNRGAVGWKVTGAAPTSERGRLDSALEDRAAAHAEAIGRASAAEASR
ncbi:MAG TPA: gluconate 2-dehydrogenase subunit 3 family protein [Vulgatibacter sp.]|nr:gluconate 2-dehydrogenase subunit 3 family protein [Vulgatibacter sp.]